MAVSTSTRAERDALLASGQPFVVAPKEVAKATKDYRTAPEIMLGCIIVSGTLDTAEVVRAEVGLTHAIKSTDAQKSAHTAFRRVWASPTEHERAAVLDWAQKIAAATSRSKCRARFVWNGPAA